MLSSLAPLWLFMLLPVWIPLLGVAFGIVADRVAGLRGGATEPSIHERIHLSRQGETHAEGRHAGTVQTA